MVSHWFSVNKQGTEFGVEFVLYLEGTGNSDIIDSTIVKFFNLIGPKIIGFVFHNSSLQMIGLY